MNYDSLTTRSGIYTINEDNRASMQDIDLRKTNRRELATIEEVTKWSMLHNGRLPMQTRDDQMQKALAQRLDIIEGTVHRGGKGKSKKPNKLMKSYFDIKFQSSLSRTLLTLST